MGIPIKRVAVLGAGVMGQGIAAHLANAGIPSYLFDIAPGELTQQEQERGLSLDDRPVRNRFAIAGLASIDKSTPPLLYTKDLARLITPCNYEDDAEKLAGCDWIVEVVVERLDVKRKVFEMVEEHRRPGSVVSSNTSGLSVADMAEGRSEEFRRHFMVTHFFNPVRYMRLLEMVPCDDTDPDLFRAMAEFGEHVLGKGIVYGKDTPNFVGNRIGTFGMTSVFHWMGEFGLGVTETDKIFGPALGRPKSAVFRTADVVGLDTMAHVLTTVAESCPDDPWHERFRIPAVMQSLIDKGALGEKSGAGFYKKTRDASGTRQIAVLNLDTLEYEEQPNVRFDAIGATRNLEEADDKIRAMVWFDDDAGRFAWKVTAETCLYSAELLGEIADDIVNIDRALRWGFNYESGPFETWDAIGLEDSVKRMKDEGMAVPQVVDTLLAKGEGSWYVRLDGVAYYWDVEKEGYFPVPVADRQISLASLTDRGKVLDRNEGATLYDLGDRIGLVEFHTKMNSIDAQIIEMLNNACDRVNNGNLDGLVIGNEAPNFSVGANIGLVGMLVMAGMWDEVDQAIGGIQDAYMKMKYCAGPVVVAPRGMALGGGCEAVMHGVAVRASAETYLGQVELGVGLIPAGGGCKEMAFRFYGSAPGSVKPNLFPLMEHVFRTIGTGTVSGSAEEGRALGFLRQTDKVTLNPDNVLADAKADVLAMLATGYKPPMPTTVQVPGRDGIATLKVAAHGMRGGGYISEYDEYLARKLAHVICGGDVPPGTARTEQDFLDLERAAFLELCHEEKTMARIQHMLATGKPLRN
ncbi:MAG TPA: 3-hydroxyacyl-CoA dehydrogenase/enoyl-CoA hydratase family protein [Acidimicrobiia bacterium]|nr:3-hydroxyacyl-CoA dehydrogenase/enoyl-CoA hydratase family protein [Acidimicrobiia bacterium]